MPNLRTRLSKLEGATTDALKKWHRVIQHVEESQDEAIAAYEAENGPIGDDNCLIVCILKPTPREACAYA